MRRTSAISRSKDAAASTIAPSRGNDARLRRMPVTVASTEARNVAEAEQVQRLERAPFDGQRREDRVELRGRAERDLARAGQEARRFGGRRQRGRHRAGVAQRVQAGEARRAGRRLREPADGLHDAIEFEGLEGAGLHGVRGLECQQAQSMSIHSTIFGSDVNPSG